MPDEETSENGSSRAHGESREGGRAPGGSGAGSGPPGSREDTSEPDEELFAVGPLSRLPRTNAVTVTIVILFVLSATALMGVLNLQFFREYLEGEAVFWVLRGGLLVMITSIIVYFVVRERSSVRNAEELVARTTESNRLLRLLLLAERDIGSSLELEETLEQLLSYVFRLTGSEMGAVYLWDRSTGELKLAAVRGVDRGDMTLTTIPAGEGPAGLSAGDREPRIIDDASSLEGADNIFSGAASPSSVVMTPLVAGEKAVGVLAAGADRTHAYTAEHERMMRGLAELAGISITNSELYRIARKSLKAVARQREFIGLVLDEMVAGVMTSDGRGGITVFNKEAQRLTGYTREEIPRVDARPGLTLEQRPLAPLETGIHQVLNDPGRVSEGEAFILKKDGALLPVSYRIKALHEGQSVAGATAVFMEAKQAPLGPPHGDDAGYQSLLRSLGSRIEMLHIRQLERAVSRLREMDAEEWPHGREEIARALEGGSATLASLLEDAEQYLNCVTAREWDSPTECDLEAVAAGVVEHVLRIPEAEGVMVSVRLAGVPAAFGLERMIKSAMEQVVENACLAAADGGRQVEISGGEAGGFLRVEVADTGPGVRDEVREMVFQPFFSSRDGHSGLGLPIAKRVMESMGGRVTLARSPKGALFLLDFPLAPGSEGGGADAGPAPSGG